MIEVKPDPRCKGKCKGDRAAWESPAVVMQTPEGPRLACPCCGHHLTRPEVTEVYRPPNLNPDLEDNTMRFVDDICQYDVVVLKEIKERS